MMNAVFVCGTQTNPVTTINQASQCCKVMMGVCACFGQSPEMEPHLSVWMIQLLDEIGPKDEIRGRLAQASIMNPTHYCSAQPNLDDQMMSVLWTNFLLCC